MQYLCKKILSLVKSIRYQWTIEKQHTFVNYIYHIESWFALPQFFVHGDPSCINICRLFYRRDAAAATTVVSRSQESKVKVKVRKTMDRYRSRGDDDGETRSFSWPSKAANPTYVTQCNPLNGLTLILNYRTSLNPLIHPHSRRLETCRRIKLEIPWKLWLT